MNMMHHVRQCIFASTESVVGSGVSRIEALFGTAEPKRGQAGAAHIALGGPASLQFTAVGSGWVSGVLHLESVKLAAHKAALVSP